MRLTTVLMVLNLTGLTLLIPLCVADCLPQPAAPQASCHQQEVPQSEAEDTCLDCATGEYVRTHKSTPPTHLQAVLDSAIDSTATIAAVEITRLPQPALSTSVDVTPILVLRL